MAVPLDVQRAAILWSRTSLFQPVCQMGFRMPSSAVFGTDLLARETGPRVMTRGQT